MIHFPPNSKVDSGKVSRIFGVAKKLGILPEKNDKTGSLYDVVERISGKRSISGLTNSQADKLILELQGAAKVPAITRKKTRTPYKYKSVSGREGAKDYKQNIRSLITPDQQEIIKDLIAWINDHSEYKFTPENRAEYQYKTEFRKLTRIQAKAMTEGLKAIKLRIQKTIQEQRGTSE